MRVDDALPAQVVAEGDLAAGFSSEGEMRSSYREFLEGFVSDRGHLVLVEEDGGVWKSALSAVSCGAGRWFVEAVETDSCARRRGYGRHLLLHATEHLRSLGARDVTCVIYRDNEVPRRLHESCGSRRRTRTRSIPGESATSTACSIALRWVAMAILPRESFRLSPPQGSGRWLRRR